MGAVKDLLQGKWLGHPLHPGMVHVPTALWPAALIFDVLSVAGVGGLGGEVMARMAFWSIAVGLIVAAVAVPAGIADWLEIKKERPAWKLGVYHMVLNIAVAALWLANLLIRIPGLEQATQTTGWQLTLSILGTLLLGVAGYLGGMMVYQYGIGVGRMSKKKWRKIAEAGGANVPEE